MGGLEVLQKSADTTPGSVLSANSHRPGTYVACVRGKRCGSLGGLFREVSAAFRFPSYFGMNWDALDECLCDLDWLRFDRIVLVVDGLEDVLPRRPEGKRTFLSVLQTAVDHWRSEGVAFDVYLFEDESRGGDSACGMR